MCEEIRSEVLMFTIITGDDGENIIFLIVTFLSDLYQN